MAELDLTDAPLAEAELTDPDEASNTTDEWQDFTQSLPSGSAESTFGSSGYSSLAGTSDNLALRAGPSKLKMEAHFTEDSRSGSLEDLVGNLDDKITQCFTDMDSDVSDIAPVQIRTHEEIISQSRFWRDLTESFGTVMPVDWSKTIIRNKLFLPVLNVGLPGSDGPNGLPAPQVTRGGSGGTFAVKGKGVVRDNSTSSDEELGAQLDMHSMMATSHHHTAEMQENTLATADEVIKEIDAIMQQGDGEVTDAEQRQIDNQLNVAVDVDSSKALPVLPSPLFEDKLQELSSVELLELQAELEKLTQQYSEILVQELALRDEYQFEKEVKNSFISELIRVQNKRRQYAVDKKKNGSKSAKTPDRDTKYLTTIIPYAPGQLTTRHMQIMIKILAAINEDSPTTPTLLTDYILKVLCPKDAI